ncbi:MAG: ImmA/IrrE family metallo-endopeptidase [Pyrinomonadaceae bacterium]
MTVTVGGHRYSDPDVLSLIHSGREPLDPRVEVIRKARELNARLRLFGNVEDPRERLEILASFADIIVSPMTDSPSAAQNREALLFRNSSGERHAYYDPTPSEGRVSFSIAHEIAHTFFGNSLTGARFRSVHVDQSREANELERLCDLGASELLMPQEEFLEELGDDFGLHAIPRMAARFCSSYEATLFRLASTYPRLSIAGRLVYRYRKSEERRIKAASQLGLFGEVDNGDTVPEPKYRRQSLHNSSGCGGPRHSIPWNKSFDQTSCVYTAKDASEIVRSAESLPNGSGQAGSIECVRAPYQRQLLDDDFPDVLFLWWK